MSDKEISPHANENVRIAALEAALRDCITMLKALPPNVLVLQQARAAQGVLDAALESQPLYGEQLLPLAQNGQMLPEHYAIRAALDPDGKTLRIRGHGSDEQRKQVHGALQAALVMGMHFDLRLDPERARRRAEYLDGLQAAREIHGPGVMFPFKPR